MTTAQAKELASAAFFTYEGIAPANIGQLVQCTNSRLPQQPPLSRMQALNTAIKLLKLLVNDALADLLKDFIEDAQDQLKIDFPENRIPFENYIMFIFKVKIFPLIAAPSSALRPVLPRVAAVCTAALLEVNLQSALSTVRDIMRDEADAVKHHGAPPAPAAPAGAPAGGWAAAASAAPPVPNALPAGQYHPAPAGRTRPALCTTAPGPCPGNVAQIANLCYACQSTFGRCPYNNCTKQHSWANITAAEQLQIKDWLAKWLAKRKWDLFVQWSTNGGNPTTWPVLCN